jgi:hypothetical protein
MKAMQESYEIFRSAENQILAKFEEAGIAPSKIKYMEWLALNSYGEDFRNALIVSANNRMEMIAVSAIEDQSGPEVGTIDPSAKSGM